MYILVFWHIFFLTRVIWKSALSPNFFTKLDLLHDCLRESVEKHKNLSKTTGIQLLPIFMIYFPVLTGFSCWVH